MSNDWNGKKYDEIEVINRELLAWIMGLVMGVALGLIAGALLMGPT